MTDIKELEEEIIQLKTDLASARAQRIGFERRVRELETILVGAASAEIPDARKMRLYFRRVLAAYADKKYILAATYANDPNITGRCKACQINLYDDKKNRPALMPCGVDVCPYEKKKKATPNKKSGAALIYLVN